MFWAYLEDFYDVKIILSNKISISDKFIYAKTDKKKYSIKYRTCRNERRVSTSIFEK
ncbi:MAG: hypothetical protein ACLU5J_06985 [Christensenellales bacterium]